MWGCGAAERGAGGTGSRLRAGVNWTGGGELGIRLMNGAWRRRRLAEWGGVVGLYEGDGPAVRQVRWHEQYGAAFESRGG